MSDVCKKIDSHQDANNLIEIVITSVNDNDVAKDIAKKLLEKKLVACVNISSSVTSMYEWRGEQVEEKEYVLLMKTLAEKVEALEKYVLHLHPYDTPEFVVLKSRYVNQAYFDWVTTSIVK